MKANTDKMNEIVRVNIIIFMNQKNMSIMDIVKNTVNYTVIFINI